MPPIVTVTLNPALDVSGSVPAVVPDDKLRLSGLRFEAGGGGINVARAVRKLGGEALAVFPGGGASADRIAQRLGEEGVPHRRLPIDGSTRESLTVDETTSDRQFRFVLPGPALEARDVEACLDAACEALDEGSGDGPGEKMVLVLSGSLPAGVEPPAVARFVAAGRERGARVVVDTSQQALGAAVEARPFLVKPNLREFLALVGGKTDHIDLSLAEAALALLERTGTEAIVISVGIGGALLAAGRRALRFASPVVPIASRVGAGDSMVAGIAFALARGSDLEDAVRHGVAAGSAAVMTPGSELCRGEDARRLYDQLRDQQPNVLIDAT